MPSKYNLGTATAALEGCTHDLAMEADRGRAIDGKLAQVAAFSGVSISISGSVGGSVLASGHLPQGFLIALGGCVGLAAVLLLLAVAVAFKGLSPKLYYGIAEDAVGARLTPNALRRDTSEVVAAIASGRWVLLQQAVGINNRKAKAAKRAFACVGAGFTLLVLGLLVTAVGSVV